MIRCNHCGKLAPMGAASCQNCGRPLANVSSGLKGQSEQQELPAWLESLRANERPVANSKGDQPFSPSELVDENAMPSWMHLDQSRFESSDAFPALSEQPGSGSEKQAFSANSFEASSLIDEQSLPSWMRGQEASGQGMSASSLLQPESLPSWMKSLEPGGPPQQQEKKQEQYGLPRQVPNLPPPSTGIPRTPSAPLSTPQPTFNNELGQGFSARELVDQQALPGWMSGGQGPGQLPQNRPVPQGTGFAAGELLDQQSLPTWLKSQEPNKSEPVSAMGVPVSGSGQGTGMGMGMGQQTPGGVGMPATNLLDESSLPTWMREGEQSGGSGQGQGVQTSGGLAAGSLLDASVLPSWMRNTDTPQQHVAQAQNMRNTQPPARPVPSRPRGEGSVQEQSEAAANVFASMLGVAASPTLPGQQQPSTNLGVPLMPQAQPIQPVSQVVPGWQSPLQQHQTPMGYSAPSPMPPSSPPVSPLASPYGMGETPGMQNMTRMKTPPSSYPGMGGNYGQESAMSTSREAQSEGAKKKGFFDSIRDFFFK